MKQNTPKAKKTECRRCLGTGEGLPGESKDGYSGYCKDCGGTGEQDGTTETTAEKSSSLQRMVGRHGADCEKVPHEKKGGYLHAAEDDSPYEVDGLTYCGRCHHWMPRVPPNARISDGEGPAK